jgi:hypothetical protein
MCKLTYLRATAVPTRLWTWTTAAVVAALSFWPLGAIADDLVYIRDDANDVGAEVNNTAPSLPDGSGRILWESPDIYADNGADGQPDGSAVAGVTNTFKARVTLKQDLIVLSKITCQFFLRPGTIPTSADSIGSATVTAPVGGWKKGSQVTVQITHAFAADAESHQCMVAVISAQGPAGVVLSDPAPDLTNGLPVGSKNNCAWRNFYLVKAEAGGRAEHRTQVNNPLTDALVMDPELVIDADGLPSGWEADVTGEPPMNYAGGSGRVRVYRYLDPSPLPPMAWRMATLGIRVPADAQAGTEGRVLIYLRGSFLRTGQAEPEPPTIIGGTTFVVRVEKGSQQGFTRGDCNGDGVLDISDALKSLQILFLGDEPSDCLASCDSNGDRSVDISDAIHGLSFLFLGGSRPPAPFPECGPPAAGESCARSCGG